MNPITKQLNKAREEFEDFYWEKGEYNDRELGAKGYIDFLTQSHLALLKEIEQWVDRIKLECDVVVCDCGEPYKGSDLHVLIYDLVQLLQDARKEIEK